jgi:hypothetical protein
MESGPISRDGNDISDDLMVGTDARQFVVEQDWLLIR